MKKTLNIISLIINILFFIFATRSLVILFGESKSLKIILYHYFEYVAMLGMSIGIIVFVIFNLKTDILNKNIVSKIFAVVFFIIFIFLNAYQIIIWTTDVQINVLSKAFSLFNLMTINLLLLANIFYCGYVLIGLLRIILKKDFQDRKIKKEQRKKRKIEKMKQKIEELESNNN